LEIRGNTHQFQRCRHIMANPFAKSPSSLRPSSISQYLLLKPLRDFF
jgi:hypothetical protein